MVSVVIAILYNAIGNFLVFILALICLLGGVVINTVKILCAVAIQNYSKLTVKQRIHVWVIPNETNSAILLMYVSI